VEKVDEKEIKLIAENHDLDLAESTLEFENIGLDFQVVFAQDKQKQEWVLRIPRRSEVYQKAKAEKKLLDIVNKYLGTYQVPNWEIFSEDLIAYKKVSGSPVVTTNPKNGETEWVFDKDNPPKNFTQSLGEALALFHSIPAYEVEKADLVVHSAEELRKIMNSRMNKVKEAYEVDDKLWEKWQIWLEDESFWPEQTAFIHGDFYPGHVLLNTDNTVSGIIDWTEAKISDPASDFTAHYLLFGEKELENLVDSYQKAGGYTWPKMKEHIIELLSTQAITIAEFAESSGLEEYKEAARMMLKKEEN